MKSGAENACKDGIIATCVNGVVAYRVCDEKSACSAPWQTAGRFRCAQGDPVPELTATGPDGGPISPGSSDGGPGFDGASSTDATSTCTAPADQVCAGGHRYCTDSHTWTDCLTEDKNCIEQKSGGWASLADTSGGACSAKPSGAVVACKACAGSVVCGQLTFCAIAGAAASACGKPGTVVREPGTASGETYCLQGGTFMNRGAASGTELGPEASLCNPPYKPGDDVEACFGGPGSAEVCYPSCATSYVRVCRTTGKWSACHRGSL